MRDQAAKHLFLQVIWNATINGAHFTPYVYRKRLYVHVTNANMGRIAQTPPHGQKIRLKLKTWFDLMIKVGSVPRHQEQPKQRQSRLDTFFTVLFFFTATQ